MPTGEAAVAIAPMRRVAFPYAQPTDLGIVGVFEAGSTVVLWPGVVFSFVRLGKKDIRLSAGNDHLSSTKRGIRPVMLSVLQSSALWPSRQHIMIYPFLLGNADTSGALSHGEHCVVASEVQ